MRKIFLFLFIGGFVLNVSAQSPQLREIWKLYERKKYDEIIEKGDELLSSDPNNIEYNFWVGSAYYRKRMIEESYPYMLKAAAHDDPHSTIRARAKLYLGAYYFLKEDKEKSKESFIEGRKIKTYSSIKEANEYWFERFGFDVFFDNWSMIETDHFRFYFQDTMDIHHTRFMDDCEKAYKEINTFFNSELPKKIDYFVWASRIDAKNVLKRNLSFTDSYLCYIHGGNNETEGHEIAHDISFHCDSIAEFSRFISEGTAEYFDQTNLDRKAYFEELTKNTKKKKITVKDVWNNWYDYNSDFSYNMAGLFIEELILKYGKEKFLEFYTDQTYKNAKVVFGGNFEDFIRKFEEDYNLRNKKD